MMLNHCVKSVQIRSYFWSVISCILTEYREIRTRNNTVLTYLSRNGTWLKSIGITKQLSVLLIMKHNNFLSAKTSGRCLEEVFMTSWKRTSCYTEDVFNISSPRPMLAGLYFFFFWDIAKQYHEKFVFILLAVIVIVNVF